MFSLYLAILALIAGAGTLILLAVARNGARKLLFPPRRLATLAPADFGLAHEPVSFPSRDGLTLRGWFIPAPNPKGTIVLSHGYSGDCTPDLIYAPMLRAAGYNTLFFDYRGHGASDGDFVSLVYFERADLLAALDFLRSRGVARVGLLGFSMGGAVALATAPRSSMVAAVASDSAFAELRAVLQNAAIARGSPRGLASLLAWLIVGMASARLRANLLSADPIRWVGKIAPRPLLIMHAEKDASVPVSEARRLFAAAREPKELWIVPNAAHRKIEEVARDEYRQRIVEFFDRAFAMY
jgi:dipeptidyl aminopeptidase/acylaminoacyl peptidase